ncbi:MAG: hypothetical protein Q7R48_01285, partial [bacterium]|nr:hypothetical protein [bacterium]
RDKQGNQILIFVNSSGDIRGAFLNASASAVWTPVDLELETHSSTYVNNSVSSALDNKGNIQMSYEASNGTGTSIYFKRVVVGRDSNGVVQRTGWSVGTEVTLVGAANTNTYSFPSLAIDQLGRPAVVFSKADSANSGRDSGLFFSRSCSDDDSSNQAEWETDVGACASYGTTATPVVVVAGNHDTKNETFHGVLTRMPGSGALYAVYTENNAADINIIKATVNGNDYNAWAAVASPDLSIGAYSTAAPYTLTAAPDVQNNAIIYAYTDSGNYTQIRKITSDDSDADLSSPTTTIWGSSFSLYTSGNNTTNVTYYLVYNQYSGSIQNKIYYRTYSSGAWSAGETAIQGTGTNTYPSIRDEDEGNINDKGGRVDVVWATTSNIIQYGYIPLDRSSTTTQINTPRTQVVGTQGYDAL